MPKQWIYKTESSCTPERLDLLGRHGWELIAIVSDTYWPQPTRYTFKRVVRE